MSMYQCERCGGTFGSPGTLETLTLPDYKEKYSVCPLCQWPYFREVQPCKACGEPAEYLENLCESCKESILKSIQFLVTKLAVEGYDRADVLDVLAAYVEGE